MNIYYTTERNVQLVIALLKSYGLKRIIVSPGATNVTFVASVQHDPYFHLYSAPDERSASYMACGLAAETGEPVVLSCTGATASRNYIPGLTEAFYRHLPILAITSTQIRARIGNNIPQAIDRSQIQKDIAVFSTLIKTIQSEDDEWENELKMNRALISLTKDGGGPVHVDLETRYNQDYTIQELPPVRNIRYIDHESSFPQIPSGTIAVFIGSHLPFTNEDVKLIDRFCAEHDALVFCDKTSNYNGDYRFPSSLVAAQKNRCPLGQIDLMIHLGDISGDYPTMSFFGEVKEVWRVSNDGKVIDTFRRLSCVFKMSDSYFFRQYLGSGGTAKDKTLRKYRRCYEETFCAIPEELPFSNIWMAKTLAPTIPEGASVHLGILNSLRSWNFFETPRSVTTFSNVGGFGIDGGLSSLLGASLSNPGKLYFGIFGDLAFFYDINCLANRHRGNNLRILLINNGKGTEFRNYNHAAAQFGDDADPFIAAAGHYGNKSKDLIRHYAEDLGYRYLSADSKESFVEQLPVFISPLMSQPIIFEAFTDSEKESEALQVIENLSKESAPKVTHDFGSTMKGFAKKVVGKKGEKIARILLGKDE